MRPVVRGEWPKNEKGNKLEFRHYQKARRELIDRLGQYCSYCEMKLDAALAVEHVQPKKPNGASENILERESDWNNFLLSCQNCNSTKGNSDVEMAEYYWPHLDNTFRALKYSEGGMIELGDNLSIQDREKAKRTILLTGLDKHPLNDQKASDRRCFNRREVWDIAVRSKERLKSVDHPSFREQIVDTALGHAYWSIWMTVFADDADMLRRLIEAFPGTCRECFDQNEGFMPVRRQGGQC